MEKSLRILEVIALTVGITATIYFSSIELKAQREAEKTAEVFRKYMIEKIESATIASDTIVVKTVQ